MYSRDVFVTDELFKFHCITNSFAFESNHFKVLNRNLNKNTISLDENMASTIVVWKVAKSKDK